MRADALCLLFLVLVLISFFPDVFLRGGVFFVQDVMVQNVPFRQFLHEALAAGRLPLWEPRINAGFPLFAEGQVGALYPLNVLLAFLVTAARAVTVSVLVHLWAAAAATYVLLRRGIGTGHAAALTAAMAYGFGGYLVVRAMSPNFVAAAAGLPVLFYLVESGLRRGRLGRLAAAGGVLALQLLAGHAQAAAYGAVAAAVYGLARGWQLDRLRLALAGAACAFPGALLAAVQILPTWELASLSVRAGGISYAQFVNMSLPPERLLGVLLPTFFGSSATGTYWGGEAGFFIQLCPYVGVVSLALALVGAREGRFPGRGLFTALAVAGLVLSLGRYTGIFETLHQIPLLRQFRIPTRFLLWWAFGAAVLAGLGVDRLLADRRPLRPGWGPVWLLLGGVLVGAGLLNARELLALPASASLYRQELLVDLARAGAGLAVAGGLCASGFRRRPGAARWIPVIVIGAVWGDLLSFGSGFNGTLPASVYTREPATASAIRADLLRRWGPTAAPDVPASGLARVVSAVRERPGGFDWHGGWAVDTRAYEGYPETLRMYSAGLFGLANTLPGWSPLHLKRHWDFASLHPRALRLANVGYLLTEGPVRTPPGPRIYPDSLASPGSGSGPAPIVVYRMDDALPRAWVVPRALQPPAGVDVPRWLRSSAFDPRQAVALDTAPPRDPGPRRGGDYAPARVAVYEPEHVVVDLPGTDGFLVLADTYAPGWEVRVDGTPRKLQRGNYVFRAVEVRRADRRAVFTYRPASVRRGLWISIGAGLVWCLGLWGASRHRWPPAVHQRPLVIGAAVIQAALIVLLYGVAMETPRWAAILERLHLSPGIGG